ncbi:MAG: RDD family protein [Planctomycetaceae bacterium]
MNRCVTVKYVRTGRVFSHPLTLSYVRPDISSSYQFETPENVSIEHRPAGAGTRFLAWIHDQLILMVFMFVMTLVLIFVLAAVGDTLVPYLRDLAKWVNEDQEVDPQTVTLVFVGIYILIWGLSSFAYFTFGELFWRGQTPGKKSNKIRVVKVEGFSLDPVSVLVRNVFRVADNLPLLWIVPVLSARGQRLGDMVAGTCVIREDSEELPEVRTELAERKAADATFRFDHAKLRKLAPKDCEAIERILDRWDSLKSEQQLSLLDKMVPSLCRKLEVDEPTENQRVAFLEDLLSAEYRRQDRHLR